LFGRGTSPDGRVMHVIGATARAPIGIDQAIRLSAAVLGIARSEDDAPILLLVDSASQRMSRRDELLGLSEHLAHLAKSLLLAEARGHRTIGLLYGGSAAGAFIATALACDTLVALPAAHPEVMDLASMARVTKLSIDLLEDKAKTTPVLAPGLDNLVSVGRVAEVWDPQRSLADQGRQDRAMFDLFVDQPAAAPILADATAILGQDVHHLVRTAADDRLHANATSQTLCVARGLAAAAACLEPIGPALVAGYSVGEMTAWGIAGLWSPAATLRLTAARAAAMDAAGGAQDGLGFVRGLPRAAVEALVARFDCGIAIVNPGLLFVTGGTRAQVAACCNAALSQGAVTARPIAVRVASHTRRLSAAVAPFRTALLTEEPARPIRGRTLIGATDATIVRGAAGIAGLAAQIDTTIDWAATLEALVERGVERLLELGPGTALADMVGAAYPTLDVRAVDDFRSLAGITR